MTQLSLLTEVSPAPLADICRRKHKGNIHSDSDNLNGFGPGPDVATGHTHTHIGYLTLVTNPQQSANPKLGVASYSDPTVYSKLALR